MDLKIVSIADKGNINDERIGITVLKACELSFFMLFKTTFNTNGFYYIANDAFWFVPQKVAVGDKVIIYSKAGINSTKINTDATTTYFYYWQKTAPIFTSAKDGVVLSKVETWELSQGV